jgi:hypothetical protein
MNKFSLFYTHRKSMPNRFYGCTAVYSNIPIRFLDEFRKVFPSEYKIRYRGPRNTSMDMNRSLLNRQSSCLKLNAVSFSAYHY